MSNIQKKEFKPNVLPRKLDPMLRVGELRRMLTGRGKMKMTDAEVLKKFAHIISSNPDKA